MKLVALLLSILLPLTAQATQTIRVISPYSPGHSATPALLRLVDQANSEQSIYRFAVEYRPGGNQAIAVAGLGDDSLAIIAPAFVENVDAGRLNESDYRPVYALGNACWAVITNRPLTGGGEMTIGGVGFGNAAHITGLALGERYGFTTRYVVFRSNNDALINMVGNHGVNMAIDKFEAYDGLRAKNTNLRMVAASCPRRLPQAPRIPTLTELGVRAPYIFNIVIAHRSMADARRIAIGQILDKATLAIGAEEMYNLSAMRPPVFDGMTADQFYRSSIDVTRDLSRKYRDQIEAAKR